MDITHISGEVQYYLCSKLSAKDRYVYKPAWSVRIHA